MVFKYIRKQIEKEKEKQRLEDKIMRFMRKVSLHQEEQPKLARRYFTQATRLRDQEFKLMLPNFDNEMEFDKIFLSFIKKYPFKLSYELNPELV